MVVTGARFLVVASGDTIVGAGIAQIWRGGVLIVSVIGLISWSRITKIIGIGLGLAIVGVRHRKDTVQLGLIVAFLDLFLYIFDGWCLNRQARKRLEMEIE